jgi:lipopolysaccharide biosynthesis regulator YciM
MSWLGALAVLIVTALGAWLLSQALGRLAHMRAMEASLEGFSYLLSGDPDRAIAVLTKVAATGNLEAYFALGSLFRRKGELERAIQLHRNILKAPALSPAQRLRALTELGRDFRQAQLWVEAIEVLRQAVAQPGSELELRAAWEELRDGLLAAGELQAAAEIQDRVAGGKTNALGAHLWAEAAMAALAAGDTASALAAAGRSERADPDSTHGQFAQIAALSVQRDMAETREAAIDLAERSPRTAEVVLAWLVQLEGKTGTLPRLEAALDERSRRGLLAPQTALLRAQIARDRSDTEAAVAQLQELLVRRPDFLPARQTLNEILLNTGRLAEMPEQVRALLSALDVAAPARCQRCQSPIREPSWRCPACGAFDFESPLKGG